MRNSIVGIGIVLIVIGLFGLAAEGIVFSKMMSDSDGNVPGEGAESGLGLELSNLFPNWMETALMLFVVYQIFLPFALIFMGGALIQIGRQEGT